MQIELEQCLNRIFEEKYNNKVEEALMEGKNYIEVDWNDLDDISKDVLNKHYIRERYNPASNLEHFIRSAFIKKRMEMELSPLSATASPYMMFKNVTPILKIRDIGIEYMGGLFQFNGIVISVTPPLAHLKVATWNCTTCGTQIPIDQPGEELIYPVECICGEKRRSSFVINQEMSIFIDYQEIIIQENPEEVNTGDIPRTLRARALGKELIDLVKPGSMVNVTCAMLPSKGRGKIDQRIFNTIYDINNFEVLNSESFNAVIEEGDMDVLRYLSEQPDCFERFEHSIFPKIYGRTMEKRGLMVGVMGGIDKRGVRGTINVIMIGDPGLGKSRMLQQIINSSPKGIYASGRGVTGVGLTAAAINDLNVGWRLEAGAVVLSDRGTCCVDEIDKMTTEDRENLHEAMSLQTVTIHKANIHTTLNARTSILAAANPKYGVYRDDEILTENIDLPVSLLSRFDLIYIMQDKVDDTEDDAITQVVLDDSSCIEETIQNDIIKKYILLGKTINPKLSDEAKEEIKTYYKQLRSISKSVPNSPIAITVRHLEGLVRISQAMARWHLRETISKEDAEMAILLMDSSLTKAGYDPKTGNRDVGIVSTGIPKSKRDRTKTIEDIILKGNGPVHVDFIIEEAERFNIFRDEVMRILHELSNAESNMTIFKPMVDGDLYCHIKNPTEPSDYYQ